MLHFTNGKLNVASERERESESAKKVFDEAQQRVIASS